jgi:hypothetical protein
MRWDLIKRRLDIKQDACTDKIERGEHEEKINAYKILVEKPPGKIP